MVAVADYHDSAYAFCFAVRPSHRNQVLLRGQFPTALLPQARFGELRSWRNSSQECTQGFGRRLMFGVEVLAVERGFSKVSASVDSSEGRLLKHYLRLGGIVQQNSASLLVAVSC